MITKQMFHCVTDNEPTCFFSGLPSAKVAPKEGKGNEPKDPEKKTSAKSKARPEKSGPSEVPPQKKIRSPVKPDQPSPNPSLPKRLKGKQEDPDQSKQIAILIEALRFLLLSTVNYFVGSSNLPLMIALEFILISFDPDLTRPTRRCRKR